MTTSKSARAAETDTAPPSYGHRSQAIVADGFLFTGGQIGVPLHRPGNRDLYHAEGTLAEQVSLCLQHMEAITSAVGGRRDQVVEVAAFVARPDGRATVDEALAHFFGDVRPVLHFQEVADVALHGLLEMDWIAYLDDALTPAEAADVVAPLGSLETGDEVVRTGPFLMINGVLGHGDDMTAASEDVFNQIASRLEPFEVGLEQVIKMTVYVDEFDRYPEFNVVTQRLFVNSPLPTRSVIVAPAITGRAGVRIDVVVQP